MRWVDSELAELGVFVVSKYLHRKGRLCPSCEKSEGHVTGGQAKPDARAWIEWWLP